MNKKMQPNGDLKDLAGMAALPSFGAAQAMALEGARFWARRMRAYADHLEAMSRINSANDWLAAQQSFLDRTQKDYAAETEAMAQIIQAEREAARANPPH